MGHQVPAAARPQSQDPSPRIARAPYSRRAADWSARQEEALEAAGVGRSVRQALRRWAAVETRSGRPLDFTPHQLASAGGCHVRTIYRELGQLQAAHLVQVLEPGNRGSRRAAVLCLGKAWPTWSTAPATRPHPRRVTKSPSPRDLRSQQNECPSCPPAPASGKGFQGSAGRGGYEGAFGGGEGGQKARKEPLRGLSKVLADLLVQAGANPRGIQKALQVVKAEDRLREALKSARAALAYLATDPEWITPGREVGVVMAAVMDQARGNAIRRQLVHHRRQVNRAAKKSAAAGLRPADPPEPFHLTPRDLLEMVQDYQDLLREHPPEVLARVRALAAKGGRGDLSFCQAAAQVLRELPRS